MGRRTRSRSDAPAAGGSVAPGAKHPPPAPVSPALPDSVPWLAPLLRAPREPPRCPASAPHAPSLIPGPRFLISRLIPGTRPRRNGLRPPGARWGGSPRSGAERQNRGVCLRRGRMLPGFRRGGRRPESPR